MKLPAQCFQAHSRLSVFRALDSFCLSCAREVATKKKEKETEIFYGISRVKFTPLPDDFRDGEHFSAELAPLKPTVQNKRVDEKKRQFWN